MGPCGLVEHHVGLFEGVKPDVGLLQFATNGPVHALENILLIHKQKKYVKQRFSSLFLHCIFHFI